MPIRKDLSVGSIERAKQHRTGWVARFRGPDMKPRSRAFEARCDVSHEVEYSDARGRGWVLDEIDNVTKALG